jgi:translation initiation factor 1
MPRDEHPTVYSTERGDLRKQPAKPARPAAGSLPPQQQTVYLHRESKGRGGKTVTLVKNLQLSPADLKALAKTLKQACGTGGTLRDGVIEMQGDQRQKIAAALQALGYHTKIAGG